MIAHSRPTITDADVAAVVACLRSGHLEDGDVVRAFEAGVADRLGRRYALATTNGFAAIHLALIALRVGPGDEVIIANYSCPALLSPVRLCGATPVPVDTGPRSVTLAVDDVLRRVSARTKAVIAPHIFGFLAPITALREALPAIPIIEDCAQGIGGTVDGRPLGSLTDLSVLSFYATKLVCAGDAGMVLTDDAALHKIMEDHRYYGHRRKHMVTAFNYHLSNLPAALGLSQFTQLETFVTARRRLARMYDEAFAGHPAIRTDFDGRDHSLFYRYPIEVPHRDAVMERLRQQGIGSGFGVLEGLHELLNGSPADFPHSVHHLQHLLSLPLYPSLADDDLRIVAAAVIDAVDASA